MRHLATTRRISTRLLSLLAAVMAVAGEGGAQGVAAAPRVVVLPFDFAAAWSGGPSRVREPRGWRGPPAGGGWPVSRMAAGGSVARGVDAGGGEDATSRVGEGVAALLVERLLASGGFRVLEREHLDAVLAERARDSLAGGSRRPAGEGADYVVTGAIVEFGVEESHAVGGLGRIVGLGGLGVKRPKTTVAIVARVVSARTGEVVLALRGQGISRKGSGVTLGAIVRGGGGIFSVGSSAFRESALGEATGRAVEELAGKLVERRGSLLVP